MVSIDSSSDFINLVQDGGIKKKIIVEGEGPIPEKGTMCYIYYEGRILPNKEVFDSVYNRKDRTQNFNFLLGEGHVIIALEEAVKSMKKGEVAIINVTPQYAYGKLGCPPRIPANTDLEFEIELSFFESLKTTTKKFNSVEERIQESEKEKSQGNIFFKENLYKKASKSYNKALSYFDGVNDFTNQESEKVKSIKIILYTNLSVCYLKLDEISKSIKSAQKALEIDENNWKAYFRLGQAFSASSDLSLAKSNLHKAGILNPNEISIRTELADVNKKIEQENANKKNEPTLFKGMFTK
jgi:tetratricopeptide (TPR) repeat protein